MQQGGVTCGLFGKRVLRIYRSKINFPRESFEFSSRVRPPFLGSLSSIMLPTRLFTYQKINTRFFHKKKVYKKMRLKWPKSQENHKALVQENAKKITVHLLYMPEIAIGSIFANSRTKIETYGGPINTE